nr:natural cytotoxicity triggering receptor 3-like [Caretta caretta]
MFIALVHEGLTVRQSPAVLRASPGETVNLSCSFENRQGSVVKATWTIAPGVVLESHHPFYSGRLNVSDLDLLRKGEATLTLSELEQRDSGLYRCQISIHQGESGTGAGTELQVMGRNQSDTGFPGGRELCRASGPLFYRAVISLLLVVLFSLGIILRLRPWSGTGSTRVLPSLPVPNGSMASLCGLVSSLCPTPDPAASQHRARGPCINSPSVLPQRWLHFIAGGISLSLVLIGLHPRRVSPQSAQ